MSENLKVWAEILEGIAAQASVLEKIIRSGNKDIPTEILADALGGVSFSIYNLSFELADFAMIEERKEDAKELAS